MTGTGGLNPLAPIDYRDDPRFAAGRMLLAHQRDAERDSVPDPAPPRPVYLAEWVHLPWPTR